MNTAQHCRFIWDLKKQQKNKTKHTKKNLEIQKNSTSLQEHTKKL